MGRGSDIYDMYSGELRAVTDKAILFYDGEQEIWLPKSQIQVRSCKVDQQTGVKYVELDIPEWLAYDKGLI